MALTRRALLEQIGRVGGLGAAYMAMETLGLAIPTPAGAENFALPKATGGGRSVVILGAGIAGLVSAYELQRAGYRVTVIEARDRIGGRAWSIRNGDRIVQTGRPDQSATFSEGLYFNAGPARIPSTHRVMLGYARKFGVPMEVFVNTNRNAGWDIGGHVLPERRWKYDMQGRIAELLVKAIDQHALDQAIPKDELGMVRDFVHAFGDLGNDGKFAGSSSSGYAQDPGGYDRPGEIFDPMTFKELLPSPSIGLPMIFETIWDMQAVMLQPVGGMDRIAHAIYDQVKPLVRLRTPVTGIRRAGDRVTIEHGAARTEADYCICTLPAPILERIPSDFSPAKKAALKGIPYLASVKLAFESPRFWEADDNLYGGVAWTDRMNENILYPSGGIHRPRGIIVAAYAAGWTRRGNPAEFAALSHEERARVCSESIEALHPGKSHLLQKPISVAWGLTPYSEGVGAIGPDFGEQRRGARYSELLKPEGPIVFAGEHLSYQGTWQEGAALSAHEALKLVTAMANERAIAG